MTAKRGAVGAVVGLVSVAALAWLALVTGPAREASPAGAASSAAGGMQGVEGMAGMEGMPGMAMGAAGVDGSIRVSDQDVATFGVTFGSVEVRPLPRTVRAVGLVVVDETRVAFVSPKFGGWAERVHADFTGQAVREGDPLLDVYAPELVSAQEELLLAARMLDSLGASRVASVASAAREMYDAVLRRLAYWDVPGDQIDAVLATSEVRRTLTLRAPVSGVVTGKEIFAGQAFEPGATLYVISDLSRVWVNAEVFEADAALVRVGTQAEIAINAAAGPTHTGRVEYVYPTLDDRTRSMRARIALSNPGGALKPGMYATVTLTADMGEVLTIPESAVLHTGERAVAFVDMGGGRIMPHELVVGASGSGLVHVLSGLEPGQRVVTSAQFLLDSESNLAEVMRAMMAQMSLSDLGGR
jgi:Cu(I)/Ag(I) efflux system membrane fusion protein